MSNMNYYVDGIHASCAPDIPSTLALHAIFTEMYYLHKMIHVRKRFLCTSCSVCCMCTTDLHNMLCSMFMLPACFRLYSRLCLNHIFNLINFVHFRHASFAQHASYKIKCHLLNMRLLRERASNSSHASYARHVYVAQHALLASFHFCTKPNASFSQHALPVRNMLRAKNID